MIRNLIVVLVLSSCAAAQDKPSDAQSALPQSPDVTLKFELREPRTQFRRGELIPIRWSYAADVEGKYVLAQSPSDLESGRPESIHCEPVAQTAPGRPRTSPDLLPFLYAGSKCGLGVGGGVGGGCGD